MNNLVDKQEVIAKTVDNEYIDATFRRHGNLYFFRENKTGYRIKPEGIKNWYHKNEETTRLLTK